MTARGSGGVPPETYRAAGVNLEAAEEAVDRIRSIVRSYEEMEDELVAVDGTAPADEITAKLLAHLGVA